MAVESETYTVKLGPRWWQVRWRIALWRQERARARAYRHLSPQAREAADAMRVMIERAGLFGGWPRD